MLGLNPVALVKSELLKVDLDHNKVPDVFQLLDALEAGCKKLGSFLAVLDVEDFKAILLSLPPTVLAKLPPGTVEEVSSVLKSLPGTLTAAELALSTVETELKK